MQTRLKNATGVDVLLDVFDTEGSFLEKVRVSRNSEGTLSSKAAHAIISLRDGETAWTVERPLPCRTAARVVASTTAGTRRPKSPSHTRRRGRIGPPLTWSGAFDGRGSLQLTVRSSLVASNACGCDVVVSAGGRDSVIERGPPDAPKETSLAWPLSLIHI